MKRLDLIKWSYSRLYGKLVSFCILTSLSTIFSTLSVLLISKSIDTLLISKSFNPIVELSLYLLILLFISSVINYILTKLSVELRLRSSYNLSNKIIAQLQLLRSSFFSDKDIVSFNQQVNLDLNNIVIFAQTSLSRILTNLINIGFCFVILFNISIFAVLISCLAIVLLYTIYYIYTPIISTQYDNYVTKQSNYISKVFEQFKLIKESKIYNIDKYLKKRITNAQNELLNAVTEQSEMYFAYNLYQNIISALSNILLIILTANLIIKEDVGIGILLVLISYFEKIFESISYFFSLGKELSTVKSSYKRVADIFNEKHEMVGNYFPDAISSISIKELSFSYDYASVLKDLNFEFTNGVWVIKGENGKGKTTLLNLILGLHLGDYSGEILINNIQISEVNMNCFRKKHVAYVSQDQFLIDGNLIENVFLDKEISTERFQQMQNEYNLIIDGELHKDIREYSGGEKQKMSLMRAFLEKKDVILLDEPTSFLDEKTQNQLLDIIDTINNKSIVIIVTHDSKFDKYNSYVLE